MTIVGPISGGGVTIGGNESSQFASALLLVAPRLAGGLHLRITGTLVSEPFVAMTVAALRARGARIERSGNEITVREGKLRARNVRIPGDVTAATYPAAAAAVLGGSVTIENVDGRVREGAQGDARFFALLEAMDCTVSRRSGAVTVRRTGDLHGIRENVRDCSDVFPTLAVIATQAADPTELTGIAHTRKQESDRVRAVADGITIPAVPLCGARCHPYRSAAIARGGRRFVRRSPRRDGLFDSRAADPRHRGQGRRCGKEDLSPVL